jgi:hypothetical protein
MHPAHLVTAATIGIVARRRRSPCSHQRRQMRVAIDHGMTYGPMAAGGVDHGLSGRQHASCFLCADALVASNTMPISGHTGKASSPSSRRVTDQPGGAEAVAVGIDAGNAPSPICRRCAI